MNRRAVTACLAFALPTGGAGVAAQPANPPATRAAPVELPPIMVEESTSNVPWLYANAGGIEFLSRCSATTTRSLIEGWLAKMQLVRTLIPEAYLARTDVPEIFVLYGQDLRQTVSAEIQRELQAGSERKGEAARREGVNIAPSMRLHDRDMHASIAYIDETLFDGANLTIASGHVRYLLAGRVPDLPAWLVDGLERTYRRADFLLDPITLGPLVWRNQRESELASDPARPRALLPAHELFASEARRAVENQHPRRRQTRASEQELFCRWAIASGVATRAALWTFAARAAEEPVNEEMFEACFGFDFAELRDRLSDYLPKAVNEIVWIDPGQRPSLPPFEIERATPNQIARVRGEWERLAIGHVQRRLPEVREPYLAQARRTLRRAWDAGDRDPRLLATMGLCEIDAGNEAAGREYLEPAIAAGVVRPRAYYELARLRFAALRRDTTEAKRFSYTELAPVLQPLQRALTQSPPLPEVFGLLAEAWVRCEIPPHAGELAELATGVRLFGRRPVVAYSLALALARHGKKAEAAAALDACLGHATDESTEAGIKRLRAELAVELAQPQSAP